MPLEQSIRWISPHEHRVQPRVQIFFLRSAYLKCAEHAASDLENEVGGVLIGRVRKDAERDETYVLIEGILPALYTNSGQTHVTFTQNTLVHLNNELEEHFPGKRIVGWYHTHPRLGVFMSGHDAWLHRHFFTDQTQVALVIDPYSENGGFFCWQTNQELHPGHYVGFYELSDAGEDSVVKWKNLAPLIERAAPHVAEEEGGLK